MRTGRRATHVLRRQFHAFFTDFFWREARDTDTISVSMCLLCRRFETFCTLFYWRGFDHVLQKSGQFCVMHRFFGDTLQWRTHM